MIFDLKNIQCLTIPALHCHYFVYNYLRFSFQTPLFAPATKLPFLPQPKIHFEQGRNRHFPSPVSLPYIAYQHCAMCFVRQALIGYRHVCSQHSEVLPMTQKTRRVSSLYIKCFKRPILLFIGNTTRGKIPLIIWKFQSCLVMCPRCQLYRTTLVTRGKSSRFRRNFLLQLETSFFFFL